MVHIFVPLKKQIVQNAIKLYNAGLIKIYISVSPTPKFYFCGWFDKRHIKRILSDLLDLAAGKSAELGLGLPLYGPLYRIGYTSHAPTQVRVSRPSSKWTFKTSIQYRLLSKNFGVTIRKGYLE